MYVCKYMYRERVCVNMYICTHEGKHACVCVCVSTHVLCVNTYGLWVDTHALHAHARHSLAKTREKARPAMARRAPL